MQCIVRGSATFKMRYMPARIIVCQYQVRLIKGPARHFESGSYITAPGTKTHSKRADPELFLLARLTMTYTDQQSTTGHMNQGAEF